MVDWKYVILHIDLDSFYASVHIKQYPFMKGYPVVIGSDPRKGRGRGVVSTCSYEARAFGLHSGMPISQAWKLCPHGLYVCTGKQVGFTSYYDESNKVMNILQEYSEKFQTASVDEAYLDVTDSWTNYGSTPLAIAEHIQKRIEEELSLSASIGIAETKSIAKIASDLNKPKGIASVHNSELEKKLYNLPVRKISGIGKKTEQRLLKKNIKTIGDIAKMSRERIFLLLGKYGLHLRKIALGRNYRDVGFFRGERKSIGSERTFGTDQADWKVIHSMVRKIITRITESLKKNNLFTRTVTVKIRFQGYQTYTRSYSFKNYLTDEETLYNTALQLLEEFYSKSQRIRLIGVRVSSLRKIEGQLPLLPFLTHN